jgi:taurine transport system substrate-binding protein
LRLDGHADGFRVQHKHQIDGLKNKHGRVIAKHLDIPLETARSTLAGLQYPSLAEQLTPAYIGQDTSKANSRIARAYKDTASFLADIGEVRRADIPDSYAPYLNTQYLQRAAAGK